MPEKTKPTGIWAKLFEIQKRIKSFAVSEDSDKKAANGKSEYRYTPGWEIVETLRTHMDDLGLMLIPNFKDQESKIIEYLVYKDFHGQAMSFTKKEMFVQVSVEFTWIDVESGEKAGPFLSYGYGANGTDKSGASAMSMAERYFLLRFFHFTTREAQDEQDAHDSGNIPGIPKDQQPGTLAQGQMVQAVPAPAPYVPQAQPQTPSYCPQPPQPAYCPVAGPAYGAYPAAPQSYMPAAPAAPAAAPAPQGTQATPTGEFNEADPAIQAAITALMTFEKGTPSHQRCLNEQLGKLASLGYRCMNADFVGKIVNTAQSIRTGSSVKS